MSKADLAALMAFVASVGVTPAMMADAHASRELSWRSGVNTSREQARRLRQQERARAKRERP